MRSGSAPRLLAIALGVLLDLGIPAGLRAQYGWTTQPVPTQEWLTGVYLKATGEAIAVGSAGVALTTTDGGTQWSLRNTGTTASLSDVWSTTRLSSIAVGDSGLILATSDRGESWERRTSGVSFRLWSICFGDSLIGCAVGEGGGVLTTDGGLTWPISIQSPGAYFYDVALPQPSTAVLVGIPFPAGPGIILRTTDFGATWLPVLNDGGMPFFGVAFNRLGEGVAVGDNGRIVRSIDAGATWQPAASGVSQPLYDVAAAGDSAWFAAGGAGSILRSTNGGESWVLQSVPASSQLSAVSFLGPLDGFAVGTGGTMLATHTGGMVVGVREWGSVAPARAHLAPNYPNPFNASTTIRFTVVSQQVTIVRVYDLLGQEVSTLVNGVREPGTYSELWNASGVGSGVYVIRFQSGEAADSRKVMIIN